MGVAEEAIAGESVEKLPVGAGDAAAEEVEEHQHAVEGEAPSLIDGGVEDHGENGVLEEKSASSAASQDGGEEDKANLKGPILGGATPSEASSEWPEQGFAACDPPSGVPLAAPTGVRSVVSCYLVRIPRRADTLVDFKSSTDAEVKDNLEKKAILVAKIQEKLAERKELQAEAAEHREELRSCKTEIRNKVDKTKPLNDELKKLNEMNSTDSLHVCKSEEDLDARVASLEHRLQQREGPITIQEEKQIIREIKTLKASREHVIMNSKFRSAQQDARHLLYGQLKNLKAEINELSERKNLVAAKLQPYDEKYGVLSKEIDDLMAERKSLEAKIDGAFSKRRDLSSQEYVKNSDFHQNRKDISAAKLLAHAGDRAALEEFTYAQVERVMNLWNTDDAFRAEYLENNLPSTIRRLDTPDGRALGPNEEPFKFPKPQAPAPVPAPAAAPAPVEESKKAAPEVKPKAAAAKTKEKEYFVEAEEKVEEVDEELEREKRREAELERARVAEARKKRQAEKKQAKAQAWLEKEQLRRKEKEQEKLRKKASNTGTEEAADEADTTEKENTVPVENGEKIVSPSEEKKQIAPRRGRKPPKIQVNPPVKLPLRRKRTIQRQLYDQWQLIAAIAVALVIVLGATMVFVGRAGA